MKKCICGCGETLVKRDWETPSQFRARRVVNKKHFAVYRKKRGWFQNKGNLGKTRDTSPEICDKCKLPKMNLHRDGFGVTDPTQFCIHGLKYDKQRRAWA